MGVGIGACIPLSFKREKFRFDDTRSGFLACYDKTDFDDKFYEFNIKQDLLLNNYKDLINEFYTLIDDQQNKEFHFSENTAEHFNLTNFDEFKTAFQSKIHGFMSFSTTVCTPDCSFLVYSGSYKAFLEEYTTFTHIENILCNVIKNPLVKCLKFGEFG